MSSPLDMPQRLNHRPTIEGFIVTKHARERMAQMEVTADRIALMIREPDDRWPQPPEHYGPDRICYSRGNLGIVTIQKPNEPARILTVVWRSKKVWERRVRMGHER